MANGVSYRDGTEVQMPGPVQAFLWLCLVAGLYNGIAIFGSILLRPLPDPTPADVMFPFAFHVVAALLGMLIFMPMLMLPYWLALAFVYARNQWARVLLYIGAAFMILAALGMATRSRTGFFVVTGACLPGIAALICLQQRDAREFLRATLPGFVVRTRQY